MFSVINNLIESVLWGGLAAIALTAMLIFLPGLVCNRYRHGIAGKIFIAVGFCFFTFQAMLFTGGIKLKGCIPTVQQIEQLAQTAGQSGEDIVGELSRTLPMLKDFIVKAAQEDGTVEKISDRAAKKGEDILRTVRQKINGYLWRRVAWTAGGILLLGGYLVNDAEKQNRYSRSIYINQQNY